ncbi:MAG: molybdopterin synthase sulfur carrier subunit [Thermoprotei archaeon]|nr:MAG: molybdopterin synthase sulfur carrier subunit [Thermoprotei archaeon]
MRVKVKFIAYLASHMGVRETMISFDDKEITVNDVLNYLVKKYPQLRDEGVEDIIVLINGTPASNNTVVRDGDVLELLPPISGG